MLGGNIQFAVPRPRSFVKWDARGRGASGTRLRSVHIDAETGTIHLIVQHAILMPGDALPRAAVLGESHE